MASVSQLQIEGCCVESFVGNTSMIYPARLLGQRANVYCTSRRSRRELSSVTRIEAARDGGALEHAEWTVYVIRPAEARWDWSA